MKIKCVFQNTTQLQIALPKDEKIHKTKHHGPQLVLAKLPTELLVTLPQKHFAGATLRQDPDESLWICFKELRKELKIILVAWETDILCFGWDEIPLHACNTL